jgi:WD40 repeat protein
MGKFNSPGCRALFVFFSLFAGISISSAAPAPILQIETGGHKATIKDVIFTPDGNFLISGGDDKTIRVWDWRKGKTVRQIRGQIGSGHEGKNFALALSPDGKWLAAAGWMDATDAYEPCCGDIRLFDFKTGKLVKLLQGHDNIVYDLAFSPDGKMLASGSADQSAILWDMETLSELHRFTGHQRRISQVAFSKDSQTLITASYDKTVRLWSVPERKLRQTMQGHKTRIFALAVAPNGKFLVTGDANGQIRMWDSNSGAPQGVLAEQKVSIGSLTFSKDNKKLLASCSYKCPENEGQYVWDVNTGEAITIYKGHDDMVRATTLSPDGQWAVSAGGDNNEIHVWNFKTGIVRQKLRGVGQIVYSVGISPDKTRLAWGVTKPCPGETACPNAIGELQFEMGLPNKERSLERPRAFKKDAAQFIRAAASQGNWKLQHKKGGTYERPDAILNILKDGKITTSIERGATDGFGHSAYGFTNEGQALISGGDHGELKAYFKKNGDEVINYLGHTGQVMALAISKDGGMLVTGSADQTVRLWNLKTGELVVSLFSAKNGEWVMWTEQGYYDSSPNGDALVGWQLNKGADKEARYISARQLKKHLHSPEIIRRAIILGSAQKAAKELRGSDSELARLLSKQPPRFEVISRNIGPVADSHASIVLELGDEEGPAPKIEVIVNNRNVTHAATRGFAANTPEPVEQKNTRTLKIPLRKGKNSILITATNEFGYVTERRLELTGSQQGQLDKKGRLFVVAIGVNEYPELPPICGGPGGSCNLSYAVADASAFMQTIVEKVGPLHKETVQLLFINGGKNAPTSRNIKRQLEDFLADTKPEDTTILFLAGHGINIKEDYFFVPTNAKMKGEDKWKRNTLVRWDIFAEALEDSEGTRLMFIDTCHAANAYNAKLEKQSGDARIVVFSATKVNSVSAEFAEMGHGVFTHALLQGLSGEADHSKDQWIKILELGSYTSDKVEQLTGSSQIPIFYLSGIEDFILAQP